MSPFELPLKASEAAALADIAFQLLENRRLQDDLRNRLVSRAASLNLTSIRPYWGSLEPDPVHASAYYLAVDGLLDSAAPRPLLLRMALASAPSSALFPDALMIGRMRGAGARELVVNAVPFGCADAAAIHTFAGKVHRAFLPRPQGSAPAITVTPADPETELPAAFEGFRHVQKSTGLNVASIAAAPGRAARTLTAAIWSAIRAGWRDGYNLEAEPVAPGRRHLDAAIAAQSAFTRFRATLTGQTEAAADAETLVWAVAEFERRFSIGGTVYQFAPQRAASLIARFGAALAQCEGAYGIVRRERAAGGFGRTFDFEVAIPGAGVDETLFCLHWLKARGRPAQLVAPELATPAEASAVAAIARHYGVTLSFDAAVLDRLPSPSQWTGGRWNCRLAGAVTAARVQSAAAALRA